MKKLIILTFFIKIFLRKLMFYGSYSIHSNCFSLFLFLKPFSRPVRTLCYLKKLKENWILRQKVYSHFHVSGMSKDIHQSLRLRGVDWVGYYKTMELSFCHELLFSNPNIFATICCKPLLYQTMNSVWSNNHSLHQRFTLEERYRD